jgi:hypothetical protein
MTDPINSIISIVRKNKSRLNLKGKSGIIEMLINDQLAFIEIKNAIISQNSWLYLQPQTYDGIYCVYENNKWIVYEQERGMIMYVNGSYANEGEAIGNMLILAKYI